MGQRGDVAFKFAMLFALLALPTKLVALVIPWWVYTEIDFFGDTWSSNLGLWKWCRETVEATGDSSTACRSFSQPDEYIVTSRSLIVFGFLLLCLGLAIVAAQTWCLQELVLLGFLGPLVMCIAGALTWIASVTYADKYVKIPGNQPRDFHAGWMLAVASSGLCYLSATLFAAKKLLKN